MSGESSQDILDLGARSPGSSIIVAVSHFDSASDSTTPRKTMRGIVAKQWRPALSSQIVSARTCAAAAQPRC